MSLKNKYKLLIFMKNTYKKLLLPLSLALVLAACSEAETSSSNQPAIGSAQTSATTESTDTSTAPATNPASPTAPDAQAESTTEKCTLGRFRFITNNDQHEHFQGTFEAGGVVRYNLRDGPVRTWKRTGNRITFIVPGHNSDVTLRWTVSKTSSSCEVQEFIGKAFDGATDMTAIRM